MKLLVIKADIKITFCIEDEIQTNEIYYDITNEKSFDSITNWIRNIEENAPTDVERMLVGNKCDMNDDRKVSKERGEKVLLSSSSTFLTKIYLAYTFK